ncbi:MAG: bifunctional (p)ppGpp synthetase/guanosine-3',5'-bis(diphosphate) 3'-pyrophosphohydrolase [Oscillospiraceae bacterium]|nr:bifunctional (p)ppGpp synthetase/guanosine-3',5'-bis(diphosphate) 3'-pyrophosphohydrolase [Oscillospiraceae bacterium]
MDQVQASFEKLLEIAAENGCATDPKQLRAAFELAKGAHGGQLRKDGSPYITHPLATATIVAEIGLDQDSILAALLHDCIEDTSVSHEDIAKRFGEETANIVEGVTKLDKVAYSSKEEEQMENLRKMLLAMAKDIRVILIKLADRLHNMRTMQFQSEPKQREKSAEVMEIYAPIAHRLGMQAIKWELEDLALRYLDPYGYKEISEGLAAHDADHEQFVDHTISAMEERMRDANIRCNVSGRLKHIYSIYRKMYSQNKSLSEVLDLFAFRIIVDDIADCYNVLGHIHDMYRPIPGRFKDYIGTPKPNMYQSLHTTVIGREGIPFEVQIRTWKMHHTAEYGIAAHWKYKEGVSGKISDEDKFSWIRRLLEAQQDSDAQDFVQSLKVDMFSDEVFVFTPKGDVVSLPAGSTPIDFAYSIHSAVGNHMSVTLVNGRIVPFSHTLQNGDIVEVQTSKSSKGPSRDWLTLVKSSEARNKIRQWFKKERREENIAQGRLDFEAEVRHAGIPMALATKDEILGAAMKKSSFSNAEDMYAAIGYGGISVQKIVNRIGEIIRQQEKAETKSTGIMWNNRLSKPVHGVAVEGVDNVLIKFARCCTPVPGDDIIGFITRGAGVSVHRTDCRNYKSASKTGLDAERWLPVHWGDTNGESYETTLLINSRNRNGLVMDIAMVLTALKTKVISLSARDLGNGNASVFITMEVKDRDELTLATNRLFGIGGVREILRVGE